MADQPTQQAQKDIEHRPFTLGGPADGYTCRAACQSPGKPRLAFTFRPALPAATYAYRRAQREAETGGSHFSAVRNLLAAHVIGWDVMQTAPNGHAVPLPFSPEALDRPDLQALLGADYFDQMVNFVTGYTASDWEREEKNS